MMHWQAIGALISKDLRLFFRNRFFAFITVLSLVVFIGVYFVMPRTVDETISLAVYAPGAGGEALLRLMQAEGAEAEGLILLMMGSDDALRQAVLDEDAVAGLALPADLQPALLAGGRPTVGLYLRADAAPEMQEMMQALIEGLSLALSGRALQIEVRAETLGPDLAGEQIPYRDRMRPLFAVMVLMMEVFGLASLLSEEIESGAIRALLATPLGVRELFVAKGAVSLLLSLSQAVLLLWAIGGLGQQALILLVALLLGAAMVTGVGFLVAASGRDMLSVTGLAMLALLLLSVPPFGVLFPGLVTGWARIIPSHYLATVVHQAGNLGAGWGQIWQPLLILLAFDVAIGWAGVAVLKRRFA
jgi:ABC-2 type transport system permease protein